MEGLSCICLTAAHWGICCTVLHCTSSNVVMHWIALEHLLHCIILTQRHLLQCVSPSGVWLARFSKWLESNEGWGTWLGSGWPDRQDQLSALLFIHCPAQFPEIKNRNTLLPDSLLCCCLWKNKNTIQITSVHCIRKNYQCMCSEVECA